MAIPFKPLSNYIVIDEIVKKKTGGGLIVPDNAKSNIDKLELVTHIVVAISEELDEKGNPMVKNIKVGDRVSFSYGGEGVIVLNKKPYIVVRESSIIGTFTDPYVPETEEPESNLTLLN